VVTAYLSNAGLLPYLEQLGLMWQPMAVPLVSATPARLTGKIEEIIVTNDLIVAAVLSGNRNFEARIHANIKANFLASPPLVVAYAIAGKVNINLDSEPLGIGKDGQPVYLRDVWPSSAELQSVSTFATDASCIVICILTSRTICRCGMPFLRQPETNINGIWLTLRPLPASWPSCSNTPGWSMPRNPLPRPSR